MANARSFANQGLYLQREATPGTPATDDMRRYLGINVTNMGWDIEKEAFTPAGSKVPTAEIETSRLGSMAVEARHDYNGLLPLLAGVFGAPTTTPVPDETGAYSHVFEIKAYEADELAAFTAMFGDTTQALQASNVVFHGMTFGVTRTGLTLSTTALLRAPETGATVPANPETVAMVPTRASTYCAYLDDAWVDLGTSKLLSLYSTTLSFGDKYSPDWVVDCELDSFSQLIENSDAMMSQSMALGFDATAVAQIADAQNGELKFVRVEAEGPPIGETDANHMLTVDTCVALTPTNVSQSPVSPATVLNFDGRLMVDPVSGNVARVTLVNGLASL